MTARRKLTLHEFFDRIEAGLRYDAPRPRRRVSGDDGVLIWRNRSLKAGVIVGPALGGAFVFLGRSRAPVEAVTQCVTILKGVFAGEVLEVRADGPSANRIWMAWADAPAAHVHTFDRSKYAVDVPVFTSMSFRGWLLD